MAARRQNGFDPLATPLIVDESASIQVPGLTLALQVAGFAETTLLLNIRRPHTIVSALRQVFEQIGPP